MFGFKIYSFKMSSSTEFPSLLSDNHKVFGEEYCSGYSDEFGHWNTGFYCPQIAESQFAISCCGTELFKYCCETNQTYQNVMLIANALSNSSSSISTDLNISDALDSLMPFILKEPVLSGIICGLVLAFAFILFGICYFCSCCLFSHKIRIARSATTTAAAEVPAILPPELYQTAGNSSSTTSNSTSGGSSHIYSTVSNLSSSSLPLLEVQRMIDIIQQGTPTLSSQQVENCRSILRAISIVSNSNKSNNSAGAASASASRLSSVSVSPYYAFNTSSSCSSDSNPNIQINNTRNQQFQSAASSAVATSMQRQTLLEELQQPPSYEDTILMNNANNSKPSRISTVNELTCNASVRTEQPSSAPVPKVFNPKLSKQQQQPTKPLLGPNNNDTRRRSRNSLEAAAGGVGGGATNSIRNYSYPIATIPFAFVGRENRNYPNPQLQKCLLLRNQIKQSSSSTTINENSTS